MTQAIRRIAHRLGLRADEVEVLFTVAHPTPHLDVVELHPAPHPMAVMAADAWLTDGTTQPVPRPTRELWSPLLGPGPTTPQ